jgi:hypothetical protein
MFWLNLKISDSLKKAPDLAWLINTHTHTHTYTHTHTHTHTYTFVQKSTALCLYVCDQETPKREAKGPPWTINACKWMNIHTQ